MFSVEIIDGAVSGWELSKVEWSRRLTKIKRVEKTENCRQPTAIKVTLRKSPPGMLHQQNFQYLCIFLVHSVIQLSLEIFIEKIIYFPGQDGR